MQINESCKRWKMVFDLEDASFSDTEEGFVKAILHTAGDVAVMIDTLPSDEKLRERTLQALAMIVGEAQSQIEAVVQHAAFKHMLAQPLGAGFTYEEVFGRDIDEQLKALAENEEESLLIQEYLLGEDTEEKDGPEDQDIEN